MRTAKTIEELYDEVRDFDIVITNDAALSTALNARIETARIGSLAYTPRQIAAAESVRILGTGIRGDLKLITEIAKDTNLDFKYIHGELENIRRIRRYRMNVGDYLHTKNALEVYDSFLRQPTVEKVMGEYDPSDSPFFKGRNAAVIGLDLFDDLDKHFVPLSFKDVDIFKDGDYTIDRIYRVGNDREIADNVVDLIERDTADDTAIVMDTEGPVADAIRAALYKKNMPFKNKLAVKDLSQIRDYLQFVTLSLSFDTVRIKHIREIFAVYGAYLENRQDGYLLKRQIGGLEGKAKELAEIMRDIRNMTFGQVMEKATEARGRPQIKILLEDLGLLDTMVTASNAEKIVYAVNNVGDLHHNEQIPEDEKRGVLLVDCNNSVFIDRPFVIYVGIGPEWSPKITGKHYIDRKAEAEKNLMKFTALMQQGISRVYAVNSMRYGKPARPCSFFARLRPEGTAPDFDCVCSRMLNGPWKRDVPETFPMRGESSIPDGSEDLVFSKTSYNAFRKCPRAYMFSKIMNTPDNEYMVFGNIIHEFAEIYVCYPDLVKSKGVDHYVSLIQDRYSGISCDQMEGIDRSSVYVSMVNMMRFIDSLNLEKPVLDRDNSLRKYPNRIMEMEGLEKYSGITEMKIDSKRNPVTGSFDLCTGPLIVDYKTGKADNISKIKENMTEEAKYPEFQPIIYLALLREVLGGAPCSFKMIYVKDRAIKSMDDSTFDISGNARTVRYDTRSLEECLRDPDCPLRQSMGNNVSKFTDKWEETINILMKHPREEWNGTKVIEKLLAAVGMSTAKTNQKDAKSFVSNVTKMTKGGMITVPTELIIPRDTMDSFLERLTEERKEVIRMTSSHFDAVPAPKIDCRKCDYFKACTADIIGCEEDEDDE